jgi:hypothetical protein
MPDDQTQPSDLYSPLTWERLIALRRIFWDTRKWVAADAKPERGDDRTVIGYRAWVHARFEINKAAIKPYAEWLSIKHPGATFTFKIALMPIRFCRGDSEEAIPPKYRYPQDGEEADILEASKESGMDFQGLFRIINEADDSGGPVRVHLVYADKAGKQIMAWEIPEALDANGAAPIVMPTKPITLGPLDSAVKSKAQLEAERAAKEAEKTKGDVRGA